MPQGFYVTAPKQLQLRPIELHPEYSVDWKACLKCGETKDSIAFDVLSSQKTGTRLADICMECERAAGVVRE
jgi:hypothetical protein